MYLKQVINTYINKDIRDLAQIRNVQKFNNMLRLLADQSGSLLNVQELSNTLGLNRTTVDEYLFILQNTYIINLIPPFFRNLRSELTKTPKIFFEDTGVLLLLKYGTFVQKNEGSLFENTVYTILRKYFVNEQIYYWRTTDKKEIDFIIETPRAIFAIEVKLTYHGKKTNLDYFSSEYSRIPEKPVRKVIVTLEKSADHKYPEIELLYPWEIYSLSS